MSNLPNMVPLCDTTIASSVFVRANNGRGSTKERPGGINLIIWVEIDRDFVPAKSPIRIHGVQQDTAVFGIEFGDVSPLTASKPLKDEEQGKREGQFLKETTAR